VLTSDNVEKYLSKISEKAQRYDLFELGEKIDTYLRASEKRIESQ
jgi:replicative DNA helicase